jgi:hypothetical protein
MMMMAETDWQNLYSMGRGLQKKWTRMQPRTSKDSVQT